MILKATKSYSGTLHRAGKGTVFEVDDKLARQLIADGYPVEEFKEEAEVIAPEAEPKPDEEGGQDGGAKQPEQKPKRKPASSRRKAKGN